MLSRSWVDYRQRFDVVHEHVREHLDEPLDLISLAEVAAISPRHFHRLYVAALGESVSAMVRRVRMQRAAFLLATTQQGIPELGRACGYPNVASFTRAFREVHGIAPGQFRESSAAQPAVGAAVHATSRALAFTPRVDIRETAAVECLALEHRGSFVEIDRTFTDLLLALRARGVSVDLRDAWGVFHDDPTATPQDGLRSHACLAAPASLSGPVTGDSDIERLELDPGIYAVLTHRGPYSDMPARYAWLFGVWVTGEGAALRDAPVLERYLTDPRVTPPAATVTEMWLPLEHIPGRPMAMSKSR